MGLYTERQKLCWKMEEWLGPIYTRYFKHNIAIRRYCDIFNNFEPQVSITKKVSSKKT